MVKTSEVSFQPGRFQPVIEVAQRDTGSAAPADTDYTGLMEVAQATIQVSSAAARGQGAVLSDPVPVNTLALVIGTLLTARNVVEQLLFIGVFVRIGSALRSAKVNALEPLIRAYNFYGHFELDSKLFVTRGLESILISCLFVLRQQATVEVANGTGHTVLVRGGIEDIQIEFYHINDAGEVAFGQRLPLKEYIVKLVKYLADHTGLSVDTRLPWLQAALDVTTEDGLNAFLRRARYAIENFVAPDRNSELEPSEKHKAAMKKLFGKEYSDEGDVIPVRLFSDSVNKAYQVLRRISLERSYAMKTIGFPAYEGGSASQLAGVLDDVLFSTVPLSLTDSTAAVAFNTSHGTLLRYQSAPGIERVELLRELVSQSLLSGYK